MSATLGQHIHNISFGRLQQATDGQLIAAYRAFDAQLRSIEYRLSTGRAAGNGATDRAVGNYRHFIATIESELANRGLRGKDAVGLLTQEAKLARRDWQQRPELKARLLQIRRSLRRVVREEARA